MKKIYFPDIRYPTVLIRLLEKEGKKKVSFPLTFLA